MELPHSRPASETSSRASSSRGSSYQLILDHILTYPGSYEIPLRTMYTLNCAPRAQPFDRNSASPASSIDSSPINQHSAWNDPSATHAFVESVMAHMAQLPTQPSSLPPSFVTSFLRRCFPSELVDVDFPQALTGLDYLKDLEARRRREVGAAMNRLAIDRAALHSDRSLCEDYPGVQRWVVSIEEKERKIEALYTQLYIVLRRWILINELSLLPFHKHNCVAMLNTLYPPVVSVQPTSKLTPPTLKKQRDGFFKYIQAVERSGPAVLSNLMRQGAAPGDENGWAAVTRTLGMYLHLANSIINECLEIANVDYFSPPRSKSSRHDRSKVDSGVSLPPSEKRPSTANSSNSDRAAAAAEIQRPKTPSAFGGSTLEKIARGLKTMGLSRTDATEMLPQEAPAAKTSPQKSRALRKMRSLGNIGERKSSASPASSLDRAAPAFDVDEMRRQRMRFEAAKVARQKISGSAVSHEI